METPTVQLQFSAESQPLCRHVPFEGLPIRKAMGHWQRSQLAESYRRHTGLC